MWSNAARVLRVHANTCHKTLRRPGEDAQPYRNGEEVILLVS